MNFELDTILEKGGGGGGEGEIFAIVAIVVGGNRPSFVAHKKKSYTRQGRLFILFQVLIHHVTSGRRVGADFAADKEPPTWDKTYKCARKKKTAHKSHCLKMGNNNQ